MEKDVFISYSVQDREIADAVCVALEGEGVQCWIAPRDVLPGVQYADAIIEALNTCKVFLIILSQSSNVSPQVAREVERAVSKDRAILTFRIDDTILSKAMEYYLSDHHWMDASKAIFSKQLHELADTVKKLMLRVQMQRGEPAAAESAKETLPVKPVAEVMEIYPRTEPPPVSPELQAVQPPPAPDHAKTSRKSSRWLWIIAPIMAGALLFYFLWTSQQARQASPVPSTPLPTFKAAKSSTPNRSATSTAEAQNIWVHGFAEPILSQIAGLPPDFSDNFSDPGITQMQWDEMDATINYVTDGVLRTRITNAWVGIFQHFRAKDFVLKFEFTPKVAEGNEGGMGVNFLNYKIDFSVSRNPENFLGFVCADSGGEFICLESGMFTAIGIMKTVQITLIVQGNQAAMYINDQPFAYAKDVPFTEEDINFYIGSWDGTIELDLDNIEFWDLGKSQSATSTAEAQNIWVHGFAEPILSQIAGLPPDFSDDFSDPGITQMQWDEMDATINYVTDGVLRTRITNAWVGIFQHFRAKDFVLKYTFKAREAEGDSGTGVGVHGYSTGFGFSWNPESWWGLGCADSGGEYICIQSGMSSAVQIMKTISITMIVQGNQIAVYVNGQPFTYAEDVPFSGEDISFYIGSWDGTIELDLDNIEFWDLSK